MNEKRAMIMESLKNWPQYKSGAIKDENLNAAVDFFSSMDDRELAFHLVRSGIGGSEIVYAVHDYLDEKVRKHAGENEPNPDVSLTPFEKSIYDELQGFSFSTARQLYDIKTLNEMPTASSARMNLGKHLEDGVIASFLDIYGGERLGFVESLVRASSVGGNEFNMRGSPDFIWKSGDNGLAYVIDIKSPQDASSVSHADDEFHSDVYIGYQFQLAYYRLIVSVLQASGELKDVKFADDCMLAELDYDLSRSSSGVVTHVVHGDRIKNLYGLMVEAGKHFYARILNGDRPNYPIRYTRQTNIREMQPEEWAEMKVLTEDLAALRGVTELIELRQGEITQKLIPLARDFPEDAKKIKLSCVKTNRIDKDGFVGVFEHASEELRSKIAQPDVSDLEGFIKDIKASIESLGSLSMQSFETIMKRYVNMDAPRKANEVIRALEEAGVSPLAATHTTESLRSPNPVRDFLGNERKGKPSTTEQIQSYNIATIALNTAVSAIQKGQSESMKKAERRDNDQTDLSIFEDMN